jgi:hypothetical protein
MNATHTAALCIAMQALRQIAKGQDDTPDTETAKGALRAIEQAQEPRQDPLGR